MSHQRIDRDPSPSRGNSSQTAGNAAKEIGLNPQPDGLQRPLSRETLSAGTDPFTPLTDNDQTTRRQPHRNALQYDAPPHLPDTNLTVSERISPTPQNSGTLSSRAQGSTPRADPRTVNLTDYQSENSERSRSRDESKESSLVESGVKTRSPDSNSQPTLTIGSEPTVRFDGLEEILSREQLLGLRQLVSQHSFQRRELSTSGSYLRQLSSDTQGLQAQVGEMSG